MKSILSVFIFFASFSFFGQTPIKDIQNISDKIQVKVNKLISDYSPTLFVNPFIGTGGHGHTYPGASESEYNRFMNDWFEGVVGGFDPWIWIDSNYFRTHQGVSRTRWDNARRKVEALKEQLFMD